MTQEQVESQLSAMFDGELPAAECELLSRRLDRDENLRSRWSRYALIGAAMRSEPVATARHGFAGRVSAALQVGENRNASVVAVSRKRAQNRTLWNAALAASMVAAVAGVSISMLRYSSPGATLASNASAPATRSVTRLPVPVPVTVSVAPAAVMPVAMREPHSYTTPVNQSNADIGLRTELADFIVAHSEYSTPLMRRSLLSALVSSEESTDSFAAHPNVAARARSMLPLQRARPATKRSTAAAAFWAASGCAALLFRAVACLGAEDDPRYWLARTDQALAKLNYEGVFVHEHGGDTETLRVIHRVASDGVSERLLSMDGSGREFIRRGTQLTCYLPDKHTVLVEKSGDTGLLLASLPRLDATSAGQYEISEMTRTRTSGRPVRVIAIAPVDEMRYGYRVWIDEASGMPLKTQLRSRSGAVLEQLVFTDLRLPSRIADSELQPAIDTRGYTFVHQDTDSSDASTLSVSWQAATLPPGFRLTTSARQILSGGPVEHLVFTDGMASVSVFVEIGRGVTGAARDDAASMGTSSAYSTVVQGFRVTAVGEVPPDTVRAIAQSIRGVGSPSSPVDSYAAMEHPLAPALRTNNTASIFDQDPVRGPPVPSGFIENRGIGGARAGLSGSPGFGGFGGPGNGGMGPATGGGPGRH